MIKAIRPLLIDRQYAVGEIIPDGVLKPERLNSLIGCKLIEEVEDLPKKEAPIDLNVETEVKKVYSESKLKRLKKEELQKIAEEENIETNGLTSAEIVSEILTRD